MISTDEELRECGINPSARYVRIGMDHHRYGMPMSMPTIQQVNDSLIDNWVQVTFEWCVTPTGVEVPEFARVVVSITELRRIKGSFPKTPGGQHGSTWAFKGTFNQGMLLSGCGVFTHAGEQLRLWLQAPEMPEALPEPID